MPSRLVGKPLRVTNASKLVDVKPKCSSYGSALVRSQRLSRAHSLNPTQRICLESTILTKRGWGEPLLTVNSCIKFRLDLQADKSPVVVKGPSSLE
jgi:hypothetical protein